MPDKLLGLFATHLEAQQQADKWNEKYSIHFVVVSRRPARFMVVPETEKGRWAEVSDEPGVPPKGSSQSRVRLRENASLVGSRATVSLLGGGRKVRRAMGAD